MAVDLHVHTNASSDGQYSAREIVEMAKKIGLETIAITDHDSVASVEAGMMWGAKYKLEVIPACELFSLYKERNLHILGYYIDPLNRELLDLCQRSAEDSIRRIDRQLEVLRAAGFYLEKEKVLAQCANKPPLVSNFVEAIFEDERNKNNPLVKEYKQKSMGIIDFCHDYMCMGKIYYIPQYVPEAELVLKAIQQSGGIAVLAHPGVSLLKDDRLILDELVEMGLVGLEVYTSHHTPEEEQLYGNYCREKGLIYTCGSDFHGFYKPHVKMGEIKNNTQEVAEVLKATWEAKRKKTHNTEEQPKK